MRDTPLRVSRYTVGALVFYGALSVRFELLRRIGAVSSICNQVKTIDNRFRARLTSQQSDNARSATSKEFAEPSVRGECKRLCDG